MRKVSYFKFDYYRTVHDPDFTEDEHVFKTHIGQFPGGLCHSGFRSGFATFANGHHKIIALRY